MAIQVRKGIKVTPSLDLIYGVEGVGKSSLAATYPKPLFLDTEGSTSDLDVHAIEVLDYATFVEAVMFACKSTEYQTVVIDTVDWLDDLVLSAILSEDHAKSITEPKLYGFGMGALRVKEYWKRNLIPIFRAILGSGKNLVLLGHSVIKGVDDPINGRFDQYILKMSKESAIVLKEYVRNMLFVNFEWQVDHKKGFEKDKLKGGKIRHIYSVRSPQFEAKKRTAGLGEDMIYPEGINPYYHLIGTNLMNQSIEKSNEAFEAVKGDLIVSLDECTDMTGIGELWKANQSVHKCDAAKALFGEYKTKLKEAK